MFKNIINNRIIRNLTTQPELSKLTKRKWKSVVGLEVHAQISTESKLFSGSQTAFGAPLNSAVSYFDASIPGTLPVLNRKCVEYGVKTALALKCCLNEISMFDRKHYFYADLPAGYQITQQRSALANNGKITFPVLVPGKKVYYKTARLLQLQLEQDSGKSLHDDILKRSLIDLNRAGLPLIEFVFAPDLETGEEAASLVKELILILRKLKTCSCKMEEGALRVDANISIHQEGDPYGMRTEVKNIGSVRNIAHAITYEINRQLALVTQGNSVTNETRAWDAENKRTISMRDKEVLQDYRFMPEPNLPPLRISMAETSNDGLVSVHQITNELPELPEETRTKLKDTYKLNNETAIILVNEPVLLDYFFSIINSLPAISNKTITNFLINDLLAFCNKANIDLNQCNITENHLKDIFKYLHAEKINLLAAKSLVEIVHNNPDTDIETLIIKHDLEQISDPVAIEELCKKVIEKLPKAVQQYQKGKSKVLYALVGAVAELSNNKANMKSVVTCLEKLLKVK
ncbi:glutamyl-tRNA(Gln) amidotransferase subunit B, mitochondrial [Teleopsis dalmanni]|uniref:glutamyl-tRNA(Gln) amidotransferase subunit B, mitochondrial n=1 Tax=Teleopsis dalmanni TaxID=139649 RepID=UPI0018CF884B|nr:glutamyl-tRNA(Gln) amidotransferase subunit B, mitochondrial [Teleopsis dalmanni]